MFVVSRPASLKSMALDLLELIEKSRELMSEEGARATASEIRAKCEEIGRAAKEVGYADLSKSDPRKQGSADSAPRQCARAALSNWGESEMRKQSIEDVPAKRRTHRFDERPRRKSRPDRHKNHRRK